MLPENVKGLDEYEAQRRLELNGPNKLPEKPPPSNISIYLSQYKSPLVYVLLFAALVSFFLNHPSDAVIIGIALFVNTILGFIQESKAGKSLAALKSLLTQYVQVIRGVVRKSINIAEVVVGDLIVLEPGTKIPADGEMLFANRIFVNEAMLTGESVAVSKREKTKVFMGTIVVSGMGYMRAEKTGADTQIGKIAKDVQINEVVTPLQKKLREFSKQLLFLILSLVGFVFILGLLRGLEWMEVFKTSVALAVSAIPEGLPVSLTVILAVGMQRILKKKGLVRNLSSAETLGGVTTICIDKTGTLTKGEMNIVGWFGKDQEIALQSLVANDLDDPLTVSAFEWAKKKVDDYKNVIAKHTRLDSLPFSSQKRFFAALNKTGNKKTIFVTGAPDYLLNWTNLNKKEKEELFSEINKLTSQGKRLVGFAKKDVSENTLKISEKDILEDLVWVGMLAFTDPVREGVADALKKAAKAGIKVKIITGDYPETAKYVLKELDVYVKEDEVVVGSELKSLDSILISKIILFARTTPEQKLSIVNALKKDGEIVAMMGDGVNDAPALKQADIGIVVSNATDVAKESSDMVLLDSNFKTIIAAVEEGRGIFDNLRKVILYLLSDAFGEIMAVILSIIAGLPLPVTAAQILWINLISDGFPSLALAIDPKRKNIMNETPRDPSILLISGFMKQVIILVSVLSGGIAFLLFWTVLNKTGDVIFARSIAFASLGINSLIYVYSIKTLTMPFWKEKIFGNKWLNLSVLAGMFLQFLPFVFEPLRRFFDVTNFSTSLWLLVFAGAFFVFILIELIKWLSYRFLRYFHSV